MKKGMGQLKLFSAQISGLYWTHGILTILGDEMKMRFVVVVQKSLSATTNLEMPVCGW